MSKILIAQYYNRVDKLVQFGGTKKETSVRNEFYSLLNHYAEKKNLVLVAELPVRGTKGRDVTPDGTLKNVLRLDYGYWESKDEALDLDEEIDKKIRKGYPLNNILFEDSLRSILIQGGQEVMRINMRDPDELDRILTEFVNFKSPLVRKFEEAVQQFQRDIPTILETLRERIDAASASPSSPGLHPTPSSPALLPAQSPSSPALLPEGEGSARFSPRPPGEGPGVRALKPEESQGVRALKPEEQPGVRAPKHKLPDALLAHARELRKHMTEAEEFLWQILRNKKFLGLKFRRQHPLEEGFILDFYCDEHRLAIEIDGPVHNQQEQMERDEGRTYELLKRGVRTIRFRNEEVMGNIEKVLEGIAGSIGETPSSPDLHPTPSSPALLPAQSPSSPALLPAQSPSSPALLPEGEGSARFSPRPEGEGSARFSPRPPGEGSARFSPRPPGEGPGVRALKPEESQGVRALKPEEQPGVRALKPEEQPGVRALKPEESQGVRAAGITSDFLAAQDTFLQLCKAEINPDVTLADVREMMIQHILTSDIFNKIFDDPEFHRHNNIARELEGLVAKLFTYGERKNLLASIEHYYDAINAAAASVADHHEKQKFLKALYENFYKGYNPKAADRLGVVYTPNEIVDFMTDSANYLLEKHFGRTLWDKNVEILDPATGTGTFLCSIIDKCPKQYLAYKYKNELHANEVAILPYYIANLNIEFTFKQKMGYYEEFSNICFVDTLDNTSGLSFSGKQHSMFGLSSENSRRITEQNSRKISVIIGNPPYNANQKNENENNKNREYPFIDKRIKETYVKNSTAQKTKAYDMFARFYRWAMDRVDRNGIIAFITNRSFIDKGSFDGFRKCIKDDFEHCYIIDTKSDVRANPKIAGTTHNVFGIQTGVAMMFLVKSEKKKEPCKIEYVSLPDEWRKEEKWEWFRGNQIGTISFEKIAPDKNHNWINLTENDWEELMLLVDKDVKLGRKGEAVFELYSLGVATNRDEWVYDFDKNNVELKVKFFCEVYEREKTRWKKSDKTVQINDFVNRTIKWTEELENHLLKDSILEYDKKYIRKSDYRPYSTQYTYFSKIITHRIYQQDLIYPIGREEDNIVICFSGQSSSKPFQTIVTNKLTGLDYLEKTQCLPFYSYTEKGERFDNITDWGLEQFTTHYNDQTITKEDIFHYTYAVLHNPAYRKKYELNLKREFPRIPFYDDFRKWAGWGKKLMDLHINFETAEPYPLQEHTYEVKAEAKRQKEMFAKAEEPEPVYAKKPKVKVKLKADKAAGIIEIDELTFLRGVPKEAWDYKLGNRCALEWILDQYKEKKPKDPTIAEKFNTYRFADYKDKVIDLLKRVCTVSIETVKIVREMEKG